MGRDVLKTGTFVGGFLVRLLHVGGMALVVARDARRHRFSHCHSRRRSSSTATTRQRLSASDGPDDPCRSSRAAYSRVAWRSGDFSRQPYLEVMEYLEGVSLLPEFETRHWHRDESASAISGAHRPQRSMRCIVNVIHLTSSRPTSSCVRPARPPSSDRLRPPPASRAIYPTCSRGKIPPADEDRPYISPETGARPALSDPRSDLFSLGVLLYHLATGEGLQLPGTRRNLRKQLWRDPEIYSARDQAGSAEWMREMFSPLSRSRSAKRHPTRGSLRSLTPPTLRGLPKRRHMGRLPLRQLGSDAGRRRSLSQRRRHRSPTRSQPRAIVAVCVDLDAKHRQRQPCATRSAAYHQASHQGASPALNIPH
ncbi:MAG: hypothetical protein H6870_13405 [Methylobacteriaceae bacterium]|nr:hypothetical protein [Methylobacteriaceae bacterium]